MMIIKRNPIREWDENSKDKEDIPIRPKLMRLSSSYTYTSKGPYPSVEKVSRAIKKNVITYAQGSRG